MARDDDTTFDAPDGGATWTGGQLSVGRILSIIGVGALVVFMVQNTDRVPLSLLFWHVDSPLWLVAFGSALIGALAWIGLGVRRRHRRRVDRRESRRD